MEERQAVLLIWNEASGAERPLTHGLASASEVVPNVGRVSVALKD